MQPGTIETYQDLTWIDRFLYPFSCIQRFQSCSIENILEFCEEPTTFCDMIHERVLWLNESGIKFKYTYTSERLTINEPLVYRLIISFKTTEGMEAYKLRWANDVLSSIQPKDGQ